MEVLSHRHDSSLSQPPASLSFPEGDGGWGKGWGSRKFQASNHGLVFLVISPNPEAQQKAPHWNKRCSYHPGNSKKFKNHGQKANVREEGAPSNPVPQELTRVLGKRASETWGRDHLYISYWGRDQLYISYYVPKGDC